MGFLSGETMQAGLQPGLHVGKVQVRNPEDGEFGKFSIFIVTISKESTSYGLSGIASYDMNVKRKYLRWVLAINGKMSEEVDPETFDMGTLENEGLAYINVSYTQRKRVEEDGKTQYIDVASEFPQVADMLPYRDDIASSVRQLMLTDDDIHTQDVPF